MRNIVRVHKGQQARFSIIANQPVLNKELSYKARGLLWLCLTRPDNWSFNAQYLVNMSARDGRDAVRTGLSELEHAGYIFRRSVRDPDTGQWAGAVWLVFEYPWADLGYTEEELTTEVLEAFWAELESDDSSPGTGFPAPDKPAAGYPPADNPTLLKTEVVVKTDSTQNVEKSATALPTQPLLVRDDPEQTPAFSNELDRLFRDKIREQATHDPQWRTPRKFDTMAQKTKWRKAAAMIVELKGQAELERALLRAFQEGRKSRAAIINYVHAWAANLVDPPKGNGKKPPVKVLSHADYAAAHGNNAPAAPERESADAEIPFE